MPRKVLGIGDLHLPFHDKDLLAVVYAIIRREQPDVIVQVGDLYDFLSFTRFARSHNIMTPQDEINNARAMALAGWAKIRKLAPKAKCYQVLGNHDWRPVKKILDVAPVFESLVHPKVMDLFQFPGVVTQPNPRDELYLDVCGKSVTVIHGHKTKLGDHMMEAHENVICGHTHRGGTAFHPWAGEILAELNCGTLLDFQSPAASYTSRKRFNRWTPGVGWWDHNGPRFIPLVKKLGVVK